MKKYIFIGIIVFIILTFIFGVVRVVPTGHVGILTQFGAVQDKYLAEGLNFKLPFMQKIEKIDCRTKRIDIDGQGATKDLQNVNTYIATNYRVNPESAFNLYKTVGTEFENIIVKPAIQEATKTTLSKYTAEEVIIKREEVNHSLKETLIAKIEEKGFIIDNINIINLNFSEAYSSAIERKQVAEQEAKKAEQELEKAKVEAEKQVVAAKAEAEALKLRKEEITENLLKLKEIENNQKWIEKWDGKLPETMLGENTSIMYNK